MLNEVLSRRDWQIKEDPTDDYELVVEGLKSCAEYASVPQARRWDRITTTVKEMLEKRRKLKPDPNATCLTC
uniref:MADF domain-containing protein n=1 Tax=Angiostrongylus cantonensis TaxID=6313 RepID=A0A0K0D7G7_ANGCA